MKLKVVQAKPERHVSTKSFQKNTNHTQSHVFHDFNLLSTSIPKATRTPTTKTCSRKSMEQMQKKTVILNAHGLGDLKIELSLFVNCSHSSDMVCGSTNNVSCVCAWATHSLPSRAPVYCGCPAGTHRCVTMSRVTS